MIIEKYDGDVWVNGEAVSIPKTCDRCGNQIPPGDEKREGENCHVCPNCVEWFDLLVCDNCAVAYDPETGGELLCGDCIEEEEAPDDLIGVLREIGRYRELVKSNKRGLNDGLK